MNNITMGFKTGKYLLHGNDYRDKMIQFTFQEPTKMIDIEFIINDEYKFDKKNQTIKQVIDLIKDHCLFADSLPQESKQICINDYIYYRDNLLPLFIEDAKEKGNAIYEPDL
jgi:hypothetical protein